MPPKVSVIMSVYNGAPFIRRACGSIFSQTFTDWEFIVVDDGSTDNTFEILSELATNEPRLRVLKNEKNLRLAASLNRAILEAKGDLIARMDADDESLPERLAIQVEFMDGHPEVDVLGSGIKMVDEQAVELGNSFRPEGHAELKSKMYKETPFFHPTIMARKSFFERFNGYNPKLPFGQDADLWLRSYNSAVFCNLQIPLVRFRTRKSHSLIRTFWAVYIILASAYREHLLLSKGWYSARYALSGILAKFGLYDSRKSLLRDTTN